MGGFTQGGASGLSLWITWAMIKITGSWGLLADEDPQVFNPILPRSTSKPVSP